MPSVAELDLPTLDYMDPSLAGPRLHEVVAALRERTWLAASPLGFVVLSRSAGEQVLRSKRAAFPLQAIVELFGVGADTALGEEMRMNIIGIEGDAHRRLRNLVNPSFTPRATAARRQAVRARLEDVAASLLPRGRCEAVGELARPYVSQVIADLLGAPVEDAPHLARWSATIQQQFDATALMGDRAPIEAAVRELLDYLHALLAARRAAPREGDLLSALLAAEAEGERLSPAECVHLALDVLIGGVDTTQAQLAHGLRLFAEHPEQWARLGDDPALAPAAVDEVLRVEPITPFTARIVREELEVEGVAFPAGTLLLVASCAANRDDADPAGFDITADRGRVRSLTFGAGAHFCLGANLARAELEEAFAFLAPRMRGLALDGAPRFDVPTGIFGLHALPLRWNPA